MLHLKNKKTFKLTKYSARLISGSVLELAAYIRFSSIDRGEFFFIKNVCVLVTLML